MSALDVLLLLGIAALIVMAVRKIRKGGGRCGGCCASCGKRCACRPEQRPGEKLRDR